IVLDLARYARKDSEAVSCRRGRVQMATNLDIAAVIGCPGHLDFVQDRKIQKGIRSPIRVSDVVRRAAIATEIDGNSTIGIDQVLEVFDAGCAGADDDAGSTIEDDEASLDCVGSPAHDVDAG